MNRTLGRRDPRIGWSIASSLFLHLVLILVGERTASLFQPPFVTHPIHEVDLVSLPVAEPAAGDALPSPAAESASPSEVSSPAPAPVPRLSPTNALKPSAPVAPSSTSQPSEVDIERRIEELRRKDEERHLEETMRTLRERQGSRRSEGAPEGEGAQTGVDYTAHLHRILTEAFRETITYQSAAPEAVVRIIIDGKGRLIGTRMERRSGDRLFDDAVLRAIGKVARTLHPPPDGRVYEHGFVFKPEGIGK